MSHNNIEIMTLVAQYITLGAIIGPIFGFSLVFTGSVLWRGFEFITGPKDQELLYKFRWFSPFSFEVVWHVTKKIWGGKWSWGVFDRIKVCWEVFLLLCSWTAFWPLIAIAAVICWIILVIKTCLGLVK